MTKTNTYLEFGLIKGAKKIPYDIRENQEAYEFFMVARYLKDVISYRKGNIKNVHHKEDLQDSIKKYTALCVCKNFSKSLVYYEAGSSLMGVIDSLEYINNSLHKLCIKDIEFIGVDNSDMMNLVATYMHEGYKLKLYKKIKIVKCNLFFAKGVSLLYIFDDEKFFSRVLKNSKIAIFDYTFSLKDSIKDFVGTGKPVTFLSLNKCKEYLKGKNKILILNTSNRIDNKDKNKVTYECIYGDNLIVNRYLEELDKNFKSFVHVK